MPNALQAKRILMACRATACCAILRRQDGFTTFLPSLPEQSLPLIALQHTFFLVWYFLLPALSVEPLMMYPYRHIWHAIYKTWHYSCHVHDKGSLQVCQILPVSRWT